MYSPLDRVTVTVMAAVATAAAVAEDTVVVVVVVDMAVEEAEVGEEEGVGVIGCLILAAVSRL